MPQTLSFKLNGKKARLPQPPPPKSKKNFGGAEPIDLVIGFLTEMRSKNQIPRRLVNVVILLRSAFPEMSVNNMLVKKAYAKAGWDISKLSTLTDKELATAIEKGELGTHYNEPVLRVEPVKLQQIRTYAKAQRPTNVLPQLPTFQPGPSNAVVAKGMAKFLKDPPVNEPSSGASVSTSQKTNCVTPSMASKAQGKAAMASSKSQQQGLASASSHKESKTTNALSGSVKPHEALSSEPHPTNEANTGVSERKAAPKPHSNVTRLHKNQFVERAQGTRKQGHQELSQSHGTYQVGQLGRGGGTSNRCGTKT